MRKGSCLLRQYILKYSCRGKTYLYRKTFTKLSTQNKKTKKNKKSMIGSSLSFFLRTIVLLLSIFSTFASLTPDLCLPDQRDVLLEFKNEFKIQKPCEFVSLNLTQLRYLDLAFNKFIGILPPDISQLSKLETFLPNDNLFTGPIPTSLFKMSSLINIFLNDNQLNDLLGIENIYLLPNLQNLFINNNNFRVSPIDLNVFSSLKHLEGLDLSSIPLSTTNIVSNSNFPSHLLYLFLSGSNITEFPEFIRNQRNLQSLDLSNNNIKGQVPDWLWKLQKLVSVDLSSNSLTGFDGSLKALPGSQINMLDLSSNAFQGPLFIPSTLINYFFCL